MRRIVAAQIAVIAFVALASASPVFADASVGAFGNTSDGSLVAVAHDDQGVPRGATPVAHRSSNPTVRCVYSWTSGSSLAGPDGATAGAWALYSSGPSSCRGALLAGQFGPPHPFWVDAPTRGGGAARPVSPMNLASEALSRSQLPATEFQTWPPTGKGVVNFPTWVHVTSSWSPVSAVANAGRASVRVTATPTSMTLQSVDSTDGGATFHEVQRHCDGPGATYKPSRAASEQDGACTMAWSWPSARYSNGVFPLTVTVVYSVSWSGTGGAGTLPTLTRSSTV